MGTLQRCFFLFLLFSLAAIPGQASAEGKVRFAWAVLAETTQGAKSLDFSAPVSLPSGATLQIYLDQQPGTYLYLYLLSSSEELYVLFPESPDSYSANPPRARAVWIPAETEHFELVPPGGQEKLYLLASASRLTELEGLTTRYLARTDDQARKAAILQELKKIRRRSSSLAQTTEISVPVAGTVITRGDAADAFDSTSVDAVDLYSKILRINHE